jgi:hypothetical protein
MYEDSVVNSLFRVSALVAFAVLLAACQPRIQPIYAPSSVLMPQGLETAPLSVIRDGILDAGAAKSWKMKELEPGVIRATLDVQNKHQAVVDVVYTNKSFAINYVSSRNLLSQGARIHRSYNTWVRQLETGIYNNLGFIASKQKANPTAAAPAGTAAAAATETVFDPTGFWKVSATYSPTAMSASFCPKQRSWNFELDYRKRGGISETYWSNGVQLNVIGEHSEDFSELVFSVPGGGSDWHLTERLKMEKPQVRLTSEPKFSTSSNCVGVVDVIMNKRGGKMVAGVAPAPAPSAAPQKSAPATAAPQKTVPAPAPAPSAPVKSAPLVAAVPASEDEFTRKGTWIVRVNYQPNASNTSWCPKAADWDFALTLKNGKISETYYSNRKTLYVSGEMDDDYLDLRFNVPRGGIDWQWTERFVLDQPDKRFSAVSRGGAGGSGCTGSIDIHMKKQDHATAAKSKSSATKTPPAVAPTATAADIAWRNLEDKQDPAALREFLKEHLDSKYAAVAIQNLNKAMTGSSEGAAIGQKPAGYDTRGTWRVTAKYKASIGNSAYCARSHLWNFDLSLTAPRQSFTFWTGREGLYVNSETKKGKIVLSVNYPRGGNNWQWSDHFKLDQDQKTFLSEAQETGGAYAGCIGKIVFTMKKISNTG